MPQVEPSKITVPEVADSFLDRPQLLSALDDDGYEPATTLLCAPTGYGKTSVLAQWAHTRNERGVAWVDLDRGDNDPRRLWTAVLAALAACPLVPPSSPVRDLRGSAVANPAFVTALVVALDTLPVRVPLVLHDIHQLTDPAALQDLQALVSARTSGVRLVLCSRLDPPLSLATLRGEGGLAEIRSERLRFSLAETGALLRRSDLRLTPAHIEELHARTGGWPSGLRLATAVLRGDADPAEFFAQFARNDQPLPDFLVGAALAALSDADREVLSAISVSDPRSAVPDIGERDATPTLDRLARDTGLVSRPRRGRSRYLIDPLLSAYLRAGQRTRPSRAGASHPPATGGSAIDYERGAALENAAGTGDGALQTDLLRRSAVTLLVTGGHSVLRRGLERLGDQAVRRDPWLALCSALTHVETGDARAVEAALQLARQAWPADPEPRLAVLRAVTELFRALLSVDYGTASEPITSEHRDLDAPTYAALVHVVAAGNTLLTGGDGASGTAELRAALDIAERNGFDHLAMQCLTLLAVVAATAGDYPAMTDTSALAVDAAIKGGWERSIWSTAARSMLAYTALIRAEPVAARQYAVDALKDGRSTGQPHVVFALRAVHGAALFDSGRRHAGLQEMQQARADLGAVALPGEQAAALALLEHRAAVTLDHPEAASAVHDWLAERTGPAGEVLLMRAWAELSAGHYAAAHIVVGQVLDGSAPTLLPHTIVETLLVEATAWLTDGDVRSAQRALQAALAAAAPMELVRPFTTAEPSTRELLVQYVESHGPAEAFARRALGAGQPNRHRRTSRLTPTEKEVLERLPTMLSVEQIGAVLGIPSAEVRAQLRIIYTRLQVSSRRTAVAAAYERGLLR